ncbi:MFS transporter [Patulibacter sp.]|uniref:MFS transporter n=1 Tax=Patulibacter sp. TaxID=1912859 RepID=UPI002716DEF5|nr:MFS transporter [Patulibacter sp.]MDO9407728.1 MFS transporter [Patulibacter sp.]
MSSAAPPSSAFTGRERVILLVVCAAVLVINLSTTIVNITLPRLTEDLGATTTDLLWIVDAFNLAFAALVLAAGTLADRFGRRRLLVLGLTLFAFASFGGATAGSPGQLIAWRAVAGVGAAVIFPVTLSIISDVFSDRVRRAKAIGLWGAAAGLAIALGPVVGGFLVQHVSWNSTLIFPGAVAVLALVGAILRIPESRDPATPPLDFGGIALSIAGLGLLVYAIIEAPEHGWGSVTTLGLLAGALLVLLVFVVLERRVEHPMLDVGIFKNLRFTAAALSITFAFFALFGFIFLITQYFQFVKGYEPFSAGVRLLPFATCTAILSIAGSRIAVLFGTKLVVAGGLLMFAVGFAWTSTVDADTAYLTMALQMVLMGSGLGLTSAPATEAIMGVVPTAKAGVGSAVNDATRELGGTLGVAVVGSVALSLYRDAFSGSSLPGPVLETARESIGAAMLTAGGIARDGDAGAAATLASTAQSGFLDGLQAGCLVAAGVSLVGAILVLLWLPAHPGVAEDDAADTRAIAAAA